uniref:Uncharacterized protein n=1 Tax=Anguilla anguilla TaxID=7936 RepID=A0A0E9PBN1_ANGAN
MQVLATPSRCSPAGTSFLSNHVYRREDMKVEDTLSQVYFVLTGTKTVYSSSV